MIACHSCAFFVAESAFDPSRQNAECRRNPPVTTLVPMSTPQGMQPVPIAVFAQPIDRNWWCGEYKPRPDYPTRLSGPA